VLDVSPTGSLFRVDQFWIVFAVADLKISSQNDTIPYARRTLLGLPKVTFLEPRR